MEHGLDVYAANRALKARAIQIKYYGMVMAQKQASYLH